MKKELLQKHFLGLLIAITFYLSAAEKVHAQTWSAVSTGASPVGSMAAYNGELYTVPYNGSQVNKWDGTNWTTIGTMTGNSYGDPYLPIVYAVTVFNNNLYVGGNFGAVNGIADTCVAQWDGYNWTAITGIKCGDALSVGTDGYEIYAGGFFCGAGAYLFNGLSMVTQNNYANGDVYCYCVYNNEFYVGGEGGIAKWELGLWKPIGYGGPGNTVKSMAVFNNELYAGGSFSSSEDSVGNITTNSMAKWDGLHWSAVGTGTNGTVNALTVYNSELYAGGSFTTAGADSAGNIAKWDGTSWSPLDSGTDNTVNCLLVLDSNLYVGGWFSKAGGISANGLARWSNCFAAIMSGSTSICQGDSTTLSATPGNSYLWNTGATTQSIVVKIAGNYSCVISMSCGSETSNTISITVNSLPVVSVTPSSLVTICPHGQNGSTVTLTASGAATYSWSPSSGLSSATGPVVNASPSVTTGYTITGTDANGCKGTTTEMVTVSTPITLLSPPAVTICQGSLTEMSVGGYSFYWVPATGLSSQTGGTVTASPSVSTTYTVTGTDINGCTATKTIAVTVNSLPIASITTGGPTTFCSGGSVTLNANTGSSLSYQWQLNGTNISNATASSYSTSASGNYTCVVANSNCSATSNTITVTVNPFPLASITASGPTTFCSGGSVTLNANTGGGLSYQWQLNGTNISNATASSYSSSASGDYTCVVANGNCSSISDTIAIAVNPLPTATASSNSPVCSGNPLNLSSGGGISYSWTGPDGFSSSQQNPVILNVASVNGGIYTVTATDANTCSASATTTVVVGEGCCPPGGLFTSNIKRNGARLNWTINPTAFGYRVQYRKIGSRIWSGSTTNSNVSFVNINGLKRGVTYEWQVSTQCSSSKKGPYSTFSALVVFSTPAVRIGDESDANDDSNEVFAIYPNPTDNSASLVFNSQLAGNYVLEVMDMTGRIIINKKGVVSEGENAIVIDLSSYASGIYIVNLSNEGEEMKRGKLIKQ